MICLVLAAGYATRLYPLTENFPKPLLDVKGKTILDWLLDDIDTSKKISQYVIISNHKYLIHFNNWMRNKTLSAPIKVIDDGTESNETRLGAVKDIQFAIDELKLNDDLLVIAGDNVLDFSLCDFIHYYEVKQTSCVMRYYEESEKRLQKCGVIKIDDNDLIKDMEEKPIMPKSHWCVPPFYIYAKDDVPFVQKSIVDGCNTDAPGSFIAWLCKHKPVHAMLMTGNRYDIGNIENYNQIQNIYTGIVN
ncbi:MAG: sugar phosphate nucleotidyltransferase [Eubacteriales bacterium]